MFAISSSEPPRLEALCGECEVQGRRTVVARVFPPLAGATDDQGLVVVRRGSRGSGRWAAIQDPRAAVAADPSLATSAGAREHLRAVKEGRAEPLPGVVLEKRPRTRWVVLAEKRLKVRCPRGHAVRIERARLLAMARSRRTVTLTPHGHAV